MKVATGKVVDGKVVVEGAPLLEGASVTVLVRDDETFEATPEQKAKLLHALAQAERGDCVDPKEFMQRLRNRMT